MKITPIIECVFEFAYTLLPFSVYAYELILLKFCKRVIHCEAGGVIGAPTALQLCANRLYLEPDGEVGPLFWPLPTFFLCLPWLDLPSHYSLYQQFGHAVPS